MNYFCWSRLCVAVWLMLSWSAGSNAADATPVESSNVVIVETFSPPRLKQQENPNYPKAQQLKGGEGWVRLNYMVDPAGRPYDVTVVSASNEPAFEKEAVHAIKRWLYEPAVLDGQPIDAGVAVFITFELEGGAPGASAKFVGRYKWYLKYIEQGKMKKAAKALAGLRAKSRNLYEEAYLHLAEFNYKQRTDVSSSQLYESIKRAAAMDKDRGYLPDALLTRVLTIKLGLELQLNELGHAQNTANLLKKRELTAEERIRVDTTLAEISSLQQARTPFSTAGVVAVGNLGSHVLIHNRFSFRDVQGDIAELRLHCERGYVGFIPRPDTEYKVKEGYGRCSLMLIGTPGTTYTLVQGLT